MSDDLLVGQYSRLLANLPKDDPWPALEESGFLDMLRSEEDGGAGLAMEDLFGLALATGRAPESPPVLETMAARLVNPGASKIDDAERALTVGGIDAGDARALAAVLTAGQMVGAMIRAEEITVEYAHTRKQFGREIGKFQAIQHQIAVLAEEVMAARIAAEAAFTGSPLAISARRAGAAKLRCGQAALQVCAIAHAVHGAIGMSREYPLHHYTGRLQAWRMQHGGESWWARKLGDWALQEAQDFTALARAL